MSPYIVESADEEISRIYLRKLRVEWCLRIAFYLANSSEKAKCMNKVLLLFIGTMEFFDSGKALKKKRSRRTTVRLSK